jgi:hypothetical protein
MTAKKITPLLLAIIIIGTFVLVQPVSAATTEVKIYNRPGNEESSFSSNSNDEYLEIIARLYVDGEWRSMRNLRFEVYDPQGRELFHVNRQTSFITGYTEIAIWNRDLLEWESGDYKVKVVYDGNEGKGWPAASKTAIIHHTKIRRH